MAASHRRNFTATCLLCAAAIQIFGFVGQEVARQGQKQLSQLEQEHKDKLAKDNEKETAALRRALSGQKALASGQTNQKTPNSDLSKGSLHELREHAGRCKSDHQLAFVHPHCFSRQIVQARSAHDADGQVMVPKANYFAMVDAIECIEDGCDLDWAEEILGRLKRDERALRLQSMRKTAHLSSALQEDVPLLQKLFRSVRDARRQLEATLNMQHSVPSAFIAFGTSPTGGFLWQ